MAILLQSDREFQVWHYHVTHSQLLLRSPNNRGNAKNIDLIFYGVEYMDLPSMMDGLEVEQVEYSRLAHLSELPLTTIKEGWTYRLSTGGKEFHVISAHFRIEENDHAYMESSLQIVGKGLAMG